MTIKVLLADNHIIVMDALTLMITQMIPGAKVSRVNSMDAALEHLRQTKTHLVICDANMADGNHLEIVKKIKTIQPATKLFMLSSYNPELHAHHYLQQGADAYLSKDVPSSKIHDTILALLQQKRPAVTKDNPILSPARNISDISPIALLSKRELEVARLLITGKSIMQIAGLLQLHANTVSTYKARIFEKMDVDNIAELITVFNNFTAWSGD